MIKHLFISFLLFFSLVNLLFGQEVNNNADSVIFMSDYESTIKISQLSSEGCYFAKEIARMDIKNNEIKLFIIGGVDPIIYTNQHKFERKFKLAYFDFEDLPPEYECLTNYNKVVFDYLKKKYGEKWRKHVRKDVVGLYE